MKIHYASDLHIEFYEDEKEIMMFFPPHPEDVLVLAGDIGNPEEESFYRFIAYCCRSYKDVIYTTGNHEYYSHGELQPQGYYSHGELHNHDNTMDNIDNKIRELSATLTNFHPLLDSYYDIDDIRFIGGTLFTYYPESKYSEVKKIMRDYQYYTPEEVIERHRNTVEFLDKNIPLDNSNKKYVVVTHHLPSYTGISPEFKNHPSNYLFANHLDSLVRRDNIKAWFCGHTHSQNIVGKLHINPFGYPGECMRVLRSIVL